MKKYKFLAIVGLSGVVFYLLYLRAKKKKIVYKEDSSSSIIPPIYVSDEVSSLPTPTPTTPTTPKPPSTSASIVPPKYKQPPVSGIPETLEEARQKAISTKINTRFQNYVCYPDGNCELLRFSQPTTPTNIPAGSSAPNPSGGGLYDNNALSNWSILWEIPGSFGAGGGKIKGTYQGSPSTPTSKKSTIGTSRYIK